MIVDRCPLTFIIFAIMRIILLYILLALLGQQTTFLETENLKTSESEKSCEQRAMSNEQRFRKTQSSSQVFSFSDSQIQYYENQIRLVEGWNKKVLMDEHNSSFYAVFLNQGVTTLKKIDVAHGTVSNSAVLGGFPFVEKLKIYNGKAYFLYANDYTNNKRLYEVAIE